MKAIPRPSTAGRSRPSSAGLSRPSGQQLTPRGTSSGSLPDPILPDDDDASVDGTQYRRGTVSTATGREDRNLLCVAEQSTQTVLDDTAQTLSAVETDHTNFLKGQAAMAKSFEAISVALNTKLERLRHTNQLAKSRDVCAKRLDIVEQEVLDLRAALAKKNDELQTAKKQLSAYHALFGTAPLHIGGGKHNALSHDELVRKVLRPSIIIDVTSLSQRREPTDGAEYSGSVGIKTTASPGGAESQPLGRTAEPINEHAPAERHQYGSESALEKAKREWKLSQQRTSSGGLNSQQMMHGAPQLFDSDLVQLGFLSAVQSQPNIDTLTPSSSTSGSCSRTENCYFNAHGNPVMSTAATREAMYAQDEIIKSLEKENEILRKQRDDTVEHNQREHQRLIQELEEARETLDEKGADWSEKQKELNRLRTLMRFSQLKRDSDKLQETFVRIDELENRLRALLGQQQRQALERDDVQRLRVLEINLVKVMRGEMPWSAFPRELLRGSVVATDNSKGQDANTSHAIGRPVEQTQRQQYAPSVPCRPSTAKVQTSSMTLLPTRQQHQPPSAAELATIRSGPRSDKEELYKDDGFIQEDQSKSPEKKPPALQGPPPPAVSVSIAVSHLESNAPTPIQPPVVKDEDVSFSTITERMQAYLQRRAKQQQDEAAARKKAEEQPIRKKREQPQNSVADLGLSNFAKRLENLRKQSQFASHDEGHAQTPTTASTSSRAPLSGLPSAARHRSEEPLGHVSGAEAGGRPNSAKQQTGGVYSATGAQRPMSASVSRGISSAASGDGTRQYSLIGGRMVALR